jgi:hypothetical protein
MRPLVPVVLSSVTTSPWIPLDIYNTNSHLQIDVVITGTCTAQVDYTMDDIFNPAVTPVAEATPLVASGSATSSNDITKVVRALRLNVTAVTGGSATMKVVQQGLTGV